MKLPYRLPARRYLLGVILGTATLHAADEWLEPSVHPSADFRSAASRPKPLDELPATVRAAEGVVTLFADYDNAHDHGVPLYLVNHTASEKKFASQDGDIYIKLQCKTDDGEWARAQSHRSSWCGNSYGLVTLLPGQFVTFMGYRAAEGKIRQIRYRSLNNDDLVSNEGTGLAADEAVKVASLDDMTFDELPQDFKDLLQCQEHVPYSNKRPLSLRAEAARALRLFPKNEAALANVRRLRSQIAELPASIRHTEALKEIDQTLQHSWPKGAAKPDVIKLCLDQLSKAKDGTALLSERLAVSILFSRLNTQPDITWDLSMPEAPVWRAVIPHAVNVLNQYSDSVSTLDAFQILKNTSVIDALISDAEVESWLRSSSAQLQDCAAYILHRRGRTEQIIAIGKTLPGAQKLVALQAMLCLTPNDSSGKPQNRKIEQGSEDQVFRDHCMKTMPFEATLAIYHAIGWNWPRRGLAYLAKPWFHDPLRDHLIREAKLGQTETSLVDLEIGLPVPEITLDHAVWMLGQLGYEEDDGVFESLLEHGGYKMEEDMRLRPAPSGSDSGSTRERVLVKHFVVREAAAAVLKSRKLELPADLTLRVPPSVPPPISRRRQLIPVSPPTNGP